MYLTVPLNHKDSYLRRIIDVKLPENKKSIALKVILQPLEKTFTDSEIEKISINIIDLISKSFGGELRH